MYKKIFKIYTNINDYVLKNMNLKFKILILFI